MSPERRIITSDDMSQAERFVRDMAGQQLAKGGHFRQEAVRDDPSGESLENSSERLTYVAIPAGMLAGRLIERVYYFPADSER